MESHRARNPLIRQPSRRGQKGITLIGLVMLVAFIGVIGLAVIKIVPLYMEKMRIGQVMSDLQEELGTGGNSPAGIMNALNNQFYIESLRDLTANEVKIDRTGTGFTVRVNREARAPFFADLYFVVVIDEQVEISR
jgi:Domain of unknown function (DUF4845)